MKSPEPSVSEKMPDWPAGFWEKLDALGPLPDDFACQGPSRKILTETKCWSGSTRNDVTRR